MNSIKQEVRIQAPVSKCYEALTQQSGYRGWWNKPSEVSEVIGGEAKFRFIKNGMPVNMTFRIDGMAPNESVRWTCIAHDSTDWIGTTLNWSVRENAGSTLLSFDHAGWKNAPPPQVIQGWEHFLGSLKS